MYSFGMVPTTQEGRCPVCRAKVVARSEEDVITAKCARCKSWVEVPLRYVAE
jgi:phage FluMu protein Com